MVCVTHMLSVICLGKPIQHCSNHKNIVNLCNSEISQSFFGFHNTLENYIKYFCYICKKME